MKDQYYLNAYVYLEGNRRPKKADIASLLKQSAGLSSKRARFYLVNHDGSTFTQTAPCSELSRILSEDVALEKLSTSLSCGFEVRRHDWAVLNFTWSNTLPYGVATMPAYMGFSIASCVVDEVGIETTLQLVEQLFAVADKCSAFYGLIDFSRWEETVWGSCFAGVHSLGLPISREVEFNQWLYSDAPTRTRARSIFWGNYFGPLILDKLGGKPDFKARFESYTSLRDGVPSALVWNMENGLFVSLSTDPRIAKPQSIDPRHISVKKNLTRLQADLAMHGVIASWPPEVVKKLLPSR